MFKNKITHMRDKKSIAHHYEPLLFILIICGFNYDYFKLKKIIRYALKIYCVILVIVITISTMTCCDDPGVPQIWSLIEYAASTLTILILQNRINVFFQSLKQVDTNLRIHQKYYLQTKTQRFLVIFVIWFVRLLYTTFFCLHYECYYNFAMYLVNQFSLIALDLNRVWRFALYDEIRYRLVTLRKRLEENPEADYYLYVVNNKTVKENKVKCCLDLYKKIADAMELMTPELHASLLVSVICSLPKFVINVYHILLVIENHMPYQSVGFMLMHIFQISLFLFSPCVVAELYSFEVEKMRKILMNKLMEETDASRKQEIKLFLSYSRLRSFRYKIWGVIPVNMHLPLEVINLCTTYVIVVINFTHLYG